MIIEAGYDIHELLWPRVTKDDESGAALWVMTMDAQLRYWGIDAAVKEMGADPEQHLDEIAATLAKNERHSRYYVVAYVTRVERDPHGQWLDEFDTALRRHPALADHELLGHVVFCGEGFYSTVPHYSFRDYIGLEHLPRAASIAGPHVWSDCACAACTQFDELVRIARERHRREVAAHDEIPAGSCDSGESVEGGEQPFY